jgi:hypothetical protein
MPRKSRKVQHIQALWEVLEGSVTEREHEERIPESPA